MSYAKKEFVLQKMLRDSLPYYQVKDEENKFVIDENNAEKNSEIAKNNLSECLESLEGKFVNVRISDKMFRGEDVQNGTLKAGVFHFRIKLEETTTQSPKSGINGVDNYHSQLSNELAKLREENAQIKESIRQKEIDDLKQRIKELEKEGKEHSNSALDSLLLGIGSQILGNTQEEIKPINDNLENMAENEKSEKLQRINAAIGTLVKYDKNFINNIEKLAKLAKENNLIYKVAVEKLNSL